MAAGSGGPDLLARAGEAWAQGRQDLAERLLSELVEAEPRNVEALNSLGLIALGAGDSGAALRRFEAALAVEPKALAIRFNQVQALELAGDLDRALAALESALAIDPYYLPSILRKAELLEKLGRGPESLALCRAIVAFSPSLDGQPDPVRRAYARAVEAVRSDGDRLLADLEKPLAGIEAAWPGDDLSRARAYAEQRAGRRKVYVQQPVGGHFPYLPAIEFFPRDLFPWLAELEARTGEIAREYRSLVEEDRKGFRPYVGFGPGEPVNQWAELNHSPKWSAFFLWEDGERRDSNCARCPATAALLDSLPLLDLPGKGPTALFSILDPRTRIPPHTGSSNVRATVHLPLVVPESCFFRVGAETRRVEAGRAWAFDDTIEHEAWNDSGEPRAILILDAWNPFLTEAERAAVRLIG